MTVTAADQRNLKNLLSTIEYRVARTREEVEESYSLVYKEYLKRGYLNEDASKMRVSPYNMLPQTTTFIGIVGKNVISTATVIVDSPLGLPMDEIYHNELIPVREAKKKICEISMLASDSELFSSGVSMMLNAKKMFFIFFLFKLILDYCKEVMDLDYLCITINPKHKMTYDLLFFKDLGGLKTYHFANEAPAIAKYLDLHTIEDNCKNNDKTGLFKMFFSGNTDPEKFKGKFAFTPDDLRYFFIERTGMLKKASPEQLTYLKQCYPCFDFSKII